MPDTINSRTVQIILAKLNGLARPLPSPRWIGQPMNWTETSGLGSENTKRVLRELVALGLDDDIYRNFVHPAGHSVSDMLGYEVAQYEPYSDDVLLDRKLEWML